jgi:hypothetical protein
LHTCHTWSEDLGTVAATTSTFRANPLIFSSGDLRFQANSLLGHYFLHKKLNLLRLSADLVSIGENLHPVRLSTDLKQPDGETDFAP